MSKIYATLNNDRIYVEKEISYEENWKQGGFFSRYLKRRKEGGKSDTLFGIIIDVFLGLIGIILG